MGRPKKEDPIKHCQSCGVQLTRKINNGRMEDRAVFLKRKYCNLQCASQAHKKTNPTYSALLKRATVYRASSCEACGVTEGQLQIHHINGNPADNAPSNLMTLCASCHAKWHWEHGKVKPRNIVYCSACGALLEKSYGGMCQKHYQRFKLYGSPYLSKRKHGSQYVLVKVE